MQWLDGHAIEGQLFGKAVADLEVGHIAGDGVVPRNEGGGVAVRREKVPTDAGRQHPVQHIRLAWSTSTGRGQSHDSRNGPSHSIDRRRNEDTAIVCST